MGGLNRRARVEAHLVVIRGGVLKEDKNTRLNFCAIVRTKNEYTFYETGRSIGYQWVKKETYYM